MAEKRIPKDPHVRERVRYAQERAKDFRFVSDAVKAIMREKNVSERQAYRDLSTALDEGDASKPQMKDVR
jgi:AmiR/NasT family two-component response regulator